MTDPSGMPVVGGYREGELLSGGAGPSDSSGLPESSRVGDPQRSTADASGSNSWILAQMTKDEQKAYRRFATLDNRREVQKATPEEKKAYNLYKKIRTRVERKEAKKLRTFLKVREHITVLANDNRERKKNESSSAVYKEAVKKGYRGDRATLERRSQRYNADPKNYRDTPEPEAGGYAAEGSQAPQQGYAAEGSQAQQGYEEYSGEANRPAYDAVRDTWDREE